MSQCLIIIVLYSHNSFRFTQHFTSSLRIEYVFGTFFFLYRFGDFIPCLLVSITSVEKSVARLILGSLKLLHVFPSGYFKKKFFFFSFGFQKFIWFSKTSRSFKNYDLPVIIYLFFLFFPFSFLNLWFDVICQFWKILG